MADIKKYKVIHSSPEIDTVYKYVSATDSPAANYIGNMQAFLNVMGDDKLTNGQRILSTFKTAYDRQPLIDSGIIASDGKTVLDAGSLPLKVGTILYLEYEKINTVSFLTEGLEVVSTDEVAFKAAKLAQLEADKGYISINKTTDAAFQEGGSKEMFPNATVWIWCRSISSKTDEGNELQGEFFDLTPFIEKISTNTGRNGGNFQIHLPPLICDLDADRKWVLRKSNITQFESNDTGSAGEYVAESSLYELDNTGEAIRRNQFFFNNVIKSNDLVFIRFETLKIEAKQRYKDNNNYYVDKSMIPNRIYDMIGLVDSTTMNINPKSNDVAIDIMGRDLSKLFLEDGTYFFALENSGGVVRVAGSTQLKNSLLSRIMEEKGMKFIGLYNFTSIEEILKYIIQQLANIKIVPDSLFSAYGDRRNKRFNEINFNPVTDSKSDYVPQFEETVSNGIWQIVKLVIDKSVSQRRLADTSFSTAQGSLINFIHSACQPPLVEFFMDTYGDQFHLIIRKPPYDQKALISLIEGKVSTERGTPDTPPVIVDIDSEDVLQEILIMDDSQVYSWYHFFPKGAMINSSIDYSTAIFPAIFFDEYAQVFGSKPFQQSHAYVPYVPMSFDSENGNLLFEQGFSDMKYVIESNQYLPFTRKGTIVLNGDRRIKIGNIIRYKPTGEIFFVESVQHNIQISEGSVIDRTTTIQVTRGMVEQFIYGIHLSAKDGKSIFVSYFNLINTQLNFVKKEVNTTVSTQKKVGTKKVTKKSLNLQPATGGNADFSGDTIIYPSLVKGIAYLEKYNAYPHNKSLFIKFMNAVNHAGYFITLLPLSTNRTYIEQLNLKKENDFNASAGSSLHERGSAIDITITNTRSGKTYSKTTSEAEWLSTGVPQIANSLGLKWGNNNNGTSGAKATGRYYIDRVHFQIASESKTETITVDDIQTVEELRKVQGIDENEVFKNFKVNPYTFNFFLKNLQFSPEYKNVKSRQVYNSDQAGTDASSLFNNGVRTGTDVKVVGVRKK